MANTVYALDATIIDLCLSVFPWARYRRRDTTIKLHTQLDLRGPIARELDAHEHRAGTDRIDPIVSLSTLFLQTEAL